MIRSYDQLRNEMDNQSQAGNEYQAKRFSLDWYLLGANVGLSGGLLAALTGSLLTAISWFTAAGEDFSYARSLGTILLSMTIPLLIFGAHCLDLIDKRKDRRRASHLRKEE